MTSLSETRKHKAGFSWTRAFVLIFASLLLFAATMYFKNKQGYVPSVEDIYGDPPPTFVETMYKYFGSTKSILLFYLADKDRLIGVSDDYAKNNVTQLANATTVIKTQFAQYGGEQPGHGLYLLGTIGVFNSFGAEVCVMGFYNEAVLATKTAPHELAHCYYDSRFTGLEVRRSSEYLREQLLAYVGQANLFSGMSDEELRDSIRRYTSELFAEYFASVKLGESIYGVDLRGAPCNLSLSTNTAGVGKILERYSLADLTVEDYSGIITTPWFVDVAKWELKRVSSFCSN
ncbi:hypothetical protein AB4254_08695 [Vibrio breoganii]